MVKLGVRRLAATLLLTAFCLLPTHRSHAQQPQAQGGQPLYAVNAKYVNGVAPGYWPTAGTGLVLNLSAGTAFCGGSVVNYAGTTLTLTASATNNVFLLLSTLGAPGLPTVSTLTTGGSLAAGTYLVEATYVNPSGQTLGSAEASITTTGTTSTITITSPVANQNATGWNVYVTAVNGLSGSETKQNTTATAIGTNFTVTAIVAGAVLPTIDTTACAPWFNTTGFLSSQIPIAKVVTSGTAITSITDVRTAFFPPSAGGGTVTSVGLISPAEFTVTGSPVTTAGSLTFAKANQNANLIFAGPSTGAAAAPTFRSIVGADLPIISIAGGGTGQTTAGAAFNALSPITTLGDLIYGNGANSATRLAGNTTTTRQFLSQTGTGIASAAPVLVQPAFTDITGVAALSQLPRTHVFAATCSGAATASSTLWLFPIGQISALTCTNITASAGIPMTGAGTLKNLQFKSGTAGIVGDAVTVVKNAVATALTCTYGTLTTCSDTVDTVAVVAGDLITVRIVTGALDTTADVHVSFELQ